jgi:hypothetical protein
VYLPSQLECTLYVMVDIVKGEGRAPPPTPGWANFIPHWPLPAVRDSTRNGRWSTYDVSVLKLTNVSFRGKCARMGNTLKLPSPTKLARLGHFPPGSQAGRLAGPVFYVYVFSLANFFIMIECTPEGGNCHSVCTLWDRRYEEGGAAILPCIFN